MNTKIQLAIVDDDLLFVQLLKNYIDNYINTEVVLTASTGNKFLNGIREKQINIDVVILDLRMKDGSGLDVLEALKKEDKAIKTIVLSSFYRRSFMGQMLKLGVNAFLPKETDQEELIKVIETVYNKGHYFSEEQVDVMRKQLSNKLPEFRNQNVDRLTSRELDILKLLCQQLTTREIADKLFISSKTVETHKSNLFIKTGVKNTTGLVIYAVQNNIINPEEMILLN